MIRLISGSTRVGGEIITVSTGVFCADEATEERLVSLGVAEYVSNNAAETVATANTGEESEDTGANTFEEQKSAEGDLDGSTDDVIPTVNTSMSAHELREIGKTVGISFKVGMTKEEMVRLLNEYYSADSEDAPNLSAELPE